MEADITRAEERAARRSLGATGALPGRRPTATHCCTASPLPLPLQPPATPCPHPSVGRAPGLRSQPSPSPRQRRQRLFPLQLPGGEGCATSAEPPHMGVGPFPTEQRALRPCHPQSGGARGPGRKRRRHDVMQTAMGFAAAAAFFWGMGWGGGEAGGCEGAVAAARCPPPSRPPPSPSLRSAAGAGAEQNPRPQTRAPPGTAPAPQRDLPGGEAVPPGRRAQPFPEGSGRCMRWKTRRGRGGRALGRGTHRAGPREKGRKRRKRKGRSLAANPRSAAGGRPQSPGHSPRRDTGGKGCGLPLPLTLLGFTRPTPPPPPPGKPGSTDPTDPSSAASLQRASLQRPSPGTMGHSRSSHLPWRGGGGPGGGCTNCATTSGGGYCLLTGAARRSAGAVSLRRPTIYVGLYPSAGTGPFFSPPRRGMCEGDCGEQPSPLRGPAPPLPRRAPSPPAAPRPLSRCRMWGRGGLQPSGFLPPSRRTPLPFPSLLAP